MRQGQEDCQRVIRLSLITVAARQGTLGASAEPGLASLPLALRARGRGLRSPAPLGDGREPPSRGCSFPLSCRVLLWVIETFSGFFSSRKFLQAETELLALGVTRCGPWAMATVCSCFRCVRWRGESREPHLPATVSSKEFCLCARRMTSDHQRSRHHRWLQSVRRTIN